MIPTIRQTFEIQPVCEIVPCDGGVRVVFQNGFSGYLQEGRPDYEYVLSTARRSLEYMSPVGFITDEASELVELNYTHESTVRYVRPDEDDPSRRMVAFWGYSTICYLTRDHPDFDRIQQTLERAIQFQESVILANYMRPIEGETESWLKLMDVRPVPAGSDRPSPGQVNGLAAC